MTALSIIETIRQELADCEPFEIICFGSQVTGNASMRSDIDIAIKAEQKIKLSSWQKLENTFEDSYLLQKVDIIDFNRVSPEFQKVIINSGIKFNRAS